MEIHISLSVCVKKPIQLTLQMLVAVIVNFGRMIKPAGFLKNKITLLSNNEEKYT